MVRDILEGGPAVDAVAPSLVIRREAGCRKCPFVETVVIIVDFSRFMGDRIADSVGIAALDRTVERTHQPDRKVLSRLPFQADAGGTGLHIICLFIRKQVGKIAVAALEITGNGISELFSDLFIMGEGIVAVTVVAVGKPDVRPFIFQRRFCIDIDDAAHRVTAVECPLRTAQHFDPVHFIEIKIES